MNKTGGGVGTNQYKIRGQAKTNQIHGYPPDEVVRRGECVWLRAGFDDIWCLVHRQIAPEMRQLAGIAPCVIKLGPKLQARLADVLPASVLGPWVSQVPDSRTRERMLRRMPPDQLQWAAQDPDPWVRYVAAERMPPDQLQWATKDPDESVRYVAAQRMPEDQLQWAVTDKDERVRLIAAERMPPDQLQWATQDNNWGCARWRSNACPWISCSGLRKINIGTCARRRPSACPWISCSGLRKINIGTCARWRPSACLRSSWIGPSMTQTRASVPSLAAAPGCAG